ncbi:MAG: AMIN domain-containing protein, partial [bacterium]
MKPVLAVLVAAFVALGPDAAPAAARLAEGAVTSLSVVPSSGRAELVIGVAGGVEVSDFTLKSPDRIVLDVAGASLGMTARAYDHVERGGIRDVRYSQYKKGTVRVVIYLDGPHTYELSREADEVRVSVATDGGTTFAGWHIGGERGDTRTVARSERAEPDRSIDRAVDDNKAKRDRIDDTRPMRTAVQQQAQQRSQQPRITVTYQQADIRDVLAAFAAFSGRTIIPSSQIPAIRVDAEIRDQPWDVALAAILSSQGLAATEDANGILIVDTQDRIALRAQTEPLQTRVVRLNYQRATPVGEQLRTRLLQCIPSERGGSSAGQAPAAGAPPAQPIVSGGATPGASDQGSTCHGRGSISADEVTNSISITAPVSMLDDLVAFSESLDLRQPQVNIK